MSPTNKAQGEPGAPPKSFGTSAEQRRAQRAAEIAGQQARLKREAAERRDKRTKQ
jgi:hypothetical protein